MVPNQPSKHRTPLQDQPIGRRWLPKLSAAGPATGRLPYQKEIALLRWAGIHAFRWLPVANSIDMDFFVEKHFFRKKGEDFLRSFIFFCGGWV